jgi:hypothetical protein
MPRRRTSDTDAYLRCRTYGHAWDEFAPIEMESPWYGWRLSLRCIRCSTERHDNIAYTTGFVMGRHYIYPDDYQMVGLKDERPGKEVFREELFTKLRAQLVSSNALGATDEEEWVETEEGATITPIKKATKKTAVAKKAQGGRTRRGA